MELMRKDVAKHAWFALALLLCAVMGFFGPARTALAEAESQDVDATPIDPMIEPMGDKHADSELASSDTIELCEPATDDTGGNALTVQSEGMLVEQSGDALTENVTTIDGSTYARNDSVEALINGTDVTIDISNEGAMLAAQATKTPVVSYKTHVQKKGWQGWKKNGTISGTSGKGFRVEALRIKISNMPYSGSIKYRSYVQRIGWQGWASNGKLSGTTGAGLRVEAVQIALTGTMKKHYDVYYRVHAQKYGWMGWAKNGAAAGTKGLAYRLEAIQIALVKKGGKAPGATYKGASRKTKAAYKQLRKQSTTYASVYDGALREWRNKGIDGDDGITTKVRYLLFDINNDGVKELIVGNRGYGSTMGDVYTVRRRGGSLAATWLDSIDTGFRNTFRSKGGKLYYWHNSPAVVGYPNHYGYLVSLKSGKVKMKLIDSYGVGQSASVSTGSILREYNVFTHGSDTYAPNIDYSGLSGKVTVSYVG